MIKHIVMWKVKGETAEERAVAQRRIKQAFEGLSGRIPGLRHVEVGIDFSGADHASDAVLVAEFESLVALDAYTTHPEHIRIRQELAGLRIARHQVDYAID